MLPHVDSAPPSSKLLLPLKVSSFPCFLCYRITRRPPTPSTSAHQPPLGTLCPSSFYRMKISALRMRLRPAVILFFLLLSLLLTLREYTLTASITALMAPHCGPIILITAARHGSTWLINCVHSCQFSVNGTYAHLNARTELWNTVQRGVVSNLTVEEALVYGRNMSLKLFPVCYSSYQPNCRRFLNSTNANVVVLTRDLNNAGRSLRKAQKFGVWNSSVVDDALFEDDEKGKVQYEARIQRYFQGMRRMLTELNVQWTEVQYEHIVGQRTIWLGDCWVRNCNFVSGG